VVRKSGPYVELRMASCKGEPGKNINSVEKHPSHS
jgi:hypothetical protein